MKNINIKAAFFKYHRQLGIIFSLPLALCAITAMGMLISEDFLHNEKLADFFLGLHTMEIFRSEKIEIVYVFLVSTSLLGLVSTGLMRLIFMKMHKPTK